MILYMGSGRLGTLVFLRALANSSRLICSIFGSASVSVMDTLLPDGGSSFTVPGVVEIIFVLLVTISLDLGW